MSAPTIAQHTALKAAGFAAVDVLNLAVSRRFAEIPGNGLCWHGSTNAVWQSRVEALAVQELMGKVESERRYRRCDGVIEGRLWTDHARGRTYFGFSGVLVRTAGGPYHQGFVTHLDGAALGRLIGSGWVPVSLARGAALGSHHEPAATFGRRLKLGTQELTVWTNLLAETRASARADLARQVTAAGAAGALLGTADLETRLEKCPNHHGHDRVVQASFLATTVVRFADRAQGQAASAVDATLDLAR